MMNQLLCFSAAVLLLPSPHVAAESSAAAASFYSSPAVYATRPRETMTLQTVSRFGPVGMAIDLCQPAFVMKINRIEQGGPAARTGKLKPGQIIESINGAKLKDIDPRIQLGNIITNAEATDGIITFSVRDSAASPVEDVRVAIPVLGSYQSTWPLKCAKSDTVVRQFADYLARQDHKGAVGLNGTQLLFLLSTGEERDLEVARQWVNACVASFEKRDVSHYNWHLGYGGIPLAEYYLRTGDRGVLPLLQKYVDKAEANYTVGGWGHKGTALFSYSNSGRINAAGIPTATLLTLAKQCGSRVNDRILTRAIRQFYRFAGRGITPYGDHRPDRTFIDNGKHAGLAFLMQAAAGLDPQGETSSYAKARDAAAVKGFYSTSWMLVGHGGGGLGEVWRAPSMALMADRKPRKYRAFMDGRTWFYDLSRRHDGSFAIVDGARYDNTSWGAGLGLSYTAPRKTLRITGAPATEYCQTHALPARIWGTEADDAFLSLAPAKDPDGPSPDVEGETLENGSGLPLQRLLDSPDTTNATLRCYLHHQDDDIRHRAAVALAKRGAAETITALLRSEDARVRRAALEAVCELPPDHVTLAMRQSMIDFITRPGESWWVVDQALIALSRESADLLGPSLDRLLFWLAHEEWWLRQSALRAVTPLATDDRYAEEVWHAIRTLVATNQAYNTLQPMPALLTATTAAPARVQQLAITALTDAYAQLPASSPHPVFPHPKAEGLFLENICGYLAQLPGGLDALHPLSQKRFPDTPLPHFRTVIKRDLSRHPTVRTLVQQLLGAKVDEFVAKNRKQLTKAYELTSQHHYPGGPKDVIDQMVQLYRSAGIDDYNWNMWADLRTATWSYLSFDPPPEETPSWDQVICRYRPVTFPKGSEQWFALDFDPEQAGWKQGRSPFANYDGKLPELTGTCRFTTCFCETKANTFWDKEVLVFRGTFDVPAVEEGCRYRIRVNDGDHVGRGGGYQIYINGRELIEHPKHNLYKTMGFPKGAFITREFWDDFDGSPVTIAVKTFIRYNHKYRKLPTTRIPQGRISVHFEQMKLPPLPKTHR